MRRATLIACAFVLAAIAMPGSFGQGNAKQSKAGSQATNPAAKTLAFEVVSIRQNKSGGAAHYGLAEYGPTPDGWRMSNGTLALAILSAYVPQAGGAAMYTGKQVQEQPEWTLTERYDIDARISDADRAEWQKPESQKAMLRAMLQAVLVDRCKLTVHREMKEESVYSLVVRKDGPKFKETLPDEPHPGTPVPGGGTVVTEDGGHTMHFYAVTMGSLTPLLANWTGRPVQDRTDLAGRYDFRLQRPALGGQSAQPDASDLRPSIPSALEDLGLKLESAKGQVETLVIDHVERPSEN